jgi:hypothetical protein
MAERARDTNLTRPSVAKALSPRTKESRPRVATVGAEAGYARCSCAVLYGPEGDVGRGSRRATVGANAVPRQNWRRAVIGSSSLSSTSRQSGRVDTRETSCAHPLRNATLKRRVRPTRRSRHRDGRRHRLGSRPHLRLRVVRTDDVVRRLPEMRLRVLPSAPERVAVSARPSPRRDVFAPHDNR